MVADIAIHRDDTNNLHAHIMLTMRNLDQDGFGKKNRDWNADFANAKENHRSYVKNSKGCLSIREQWTNYANKLLEQAQINERITHLSHEKRELETFPMVHLGHVAHDMEKKGKKTDRGQINRERQGYNKDVVDLQVYHHQRGEHLQKMKEKEKQFSFSTDIEKTYIQKAVSLLDQRVITLEDITARHEEKVEELKKSLNPFKLKENNMMKRCHLDKISDLESNKESYEKKQIQIETKVLLHAEDAIKMAKIRGVSSRYPDLKTAGKCLTYENALKLESHLETLKKTPVTLFMSEKGVKNYEDKLYKIKKDLNIFQTEKNHLNMINHQVNKLEKAEEQFDKLSNSPGETAKRLVSKKARQHYEELQSEANYCRDNLKEIGYKGREDLSKR